MGRMTRIIGSIVGGQCDSLYYSVWVRLKGLDFGPVSLEKLGLSNDRSVHHSASGGIFLYRVLRTLRISSGSRALDLGSGKGSAVCALAGFPFEEVLGIELSQPLVDIAEANARRLGLRNVHFVCMDAGQFRDLDRFTYIYMFNPFPSAVMKEVMENLAASLAWAQRRLTLIYYYPVCDDVIMSSGLFSRRIQINFTHQHPFFIYDHDA
jgi:tRNA1(Val) A37 N6-methylase TrmN6